MVRRLLLLGMVALLGCSSSDDDTGDACDPADQDGITGGTFALDVTIGDTGFTPTVVQVQNSSTVTLTVHNTGTKVHSFVVDCLTKNGCSSCFPAASKVGPLDPGASATATFTAPSFEGLYTTRSDAAGDTFTGQFSLN